MRILCIGLAIVQVTKTLLLLSHQQELQCMYSAVVIHCGGGFACFQIDELTGLLDCPICLIGNSCKIPDLNSSCSKISATILRVLTSDY